MDVGETAMSGVEFEVLTAVTEDFCLLGHSVVLSGELAA
jgi:hypothetical protein